MTLLPLYNLNYIFIEARQCGVQPCVFPDTGGSLGIPAHADYSSIDSRTYSSVQQSTVGSSSAVSSPTNVIYNPQNYKPDPELNTKVIHQQQVIHTLQRVF